MAPVALAGLLWGCGGGEDGGGATGGTAEMAARLAELAAAADPVADEQLNTARVRYFTGLPPTSDPAQQIVRVAQTARELLNAGHSQPALEQFLLLDQALASVGAEPVPGFRREIQELLGIAFLRLGAELACPPRPPTPDGRALPGIPPIIADGDVAGLPAGVPERVPCWRPVPSSSGSSGSDAAPTALSDSARAALGAARGWHLSLLENRPADLRARWIVNVAALAEGTWPDSVPPDFRVPLEALGGAGDFRRFPEVAAQVGLDIVSLSGGAIVEDFGGDGLPDLLVSSRGLLDQMRYFEADGDGGFVERTVEAGLEGLVGGLNMTHADYDNDGDADVFVLRGGWLAQALPNSLLRNDGGRFTDVTRAARVYSEHPTQTAAWADYDGDGWLDLFIGNESRDGESHASELYRSRGDGTFEEVAEEVGLDVARFVKGVAWGDYDDDGRPDLYLSVLHDSNRLFRNAGPDDAGRWRFEDVTERAGVAEPEASFPTWFWDFDNDGRLDIFVAGYAAQTADLVREMTGEPHGAALPRLYRNMGGGAFADVTAEQGLDRILYAMGSNFGDLDGDGWLDLHIGTGDPDLRQIMPNRMFRNLGAGAGFEEITGAGGFGSFDKGHAVSFADIDNDGDTDLHFQLGGAHEGDLAPNALYENPGFGHRWIALELVGERANRAGVGARVAVVVEDAPGSDAAAGSAPDDDAAADGAATDDAAAADGAAGGSGTRRSIHRVAGMDGSFGSNPLRLEIGLGPAVRLVAVEIRWPGSATVDRLENLELDQAYRVREGTGTAEPVDRPRVPLRSRGDAPPE